jgi:5-formyltetrahydrofolate cyclo-ligase
MTLKSDKAALRKTMGALRKFLKSKNIDKNTQLLAAKVLLLPEMKQAKIISGYMPMGSEMDVLPALKSFHVAHHQICLPVVVAAEKPLIFRRWDFQAELEAASFGVKEPRITAEELIPDVMLIPLLAFDEKCLRIGYGGGFYDRTIAEYKKLGRELVTIGIAFEGQKVGHVPQEDCDQILDIIVTETEIYRS